ncbi:hypothetical protein D7003_01420, partial [Arthrobacter oryzae]
MSLPGGKQAVLLLHEILHVVQDASLGPALVFHKTKPGSKHLLDEQFVLTSGLSGVRPRTEPYWVRPFYTSDASDEER